MKTLLVVDDEETIHRALQRTLRREPYDLLFAYDAAEAWAVLSHHPEVDAVICDHYMPGTHGLDLLGEIRRLRPEVGTVLLTAQADLKLVIAAINDGHVHRFFTKPWDPDGLRAELRELLAELAAAPKPGVRPGARTAARLRDEKMLPDQDAVSGAFIIDPT
jgi:DNA-binding NtrC family response regulator